MRTRDAIAPLVAFAALGPFGCGGSRFGSGGEPAAGQGGGAGRGDAGAGGAGATGGTAAGSGGASAGKGGTAGGAGKGGGAGASACNCTPGQYCRSGTCRSCSDLSSVQIATPEPMLDHPSSGLRFPRVADARDEFFFTLVSASRAELWFVDDPTASPSMSLGGAQTPSRSGLFYVESSGFGFDALFDELQNGQRTVLTAGWDGSTLSELGAAGAPFGAGGDDYSVALVAETGRAYFMTTRDGSPSLRTAVLGTTDAELVDLQVPARTGGGTCPRSGDDATPWVTDDGTLLVFRSLPMDASCQPVDGAATDLYVAALQPSTGMPLTPAVALAGANVTGGESTETDPSFSTDLCTLYFASDGGSAAGFDFRLFRAARR